MRRAGCVDRQQVRSRYTSSVGRATAPAGSVAVSLLSCVPLMGDLLRLRLLDQSRAAASLRPPRMPLSLPWAAPPVVQKRDEFGGVVVGAGWLQSGREPVDR